MIRFYGVVVADAPAPPPSPAADADASASAGASPPSTTTPGRGGGAVGRAAARAARAAPGDVVGIITEYARGGSLAQYLRSPGAPLLPLRLRAELALGAARGMAYLHAARLVHLDLKPDNLLLDGPPHPDAAAPVVKVADFGLARHRWASPYVPGLASISGTLAFVAPEVVADPDRVSEKADVWSFGCVLYEMAARRVPHAGVKPQAIVQGLMVDALTPDVPPDAEPPWADLMTACWAPRPRDRPSFRELADRLAALVDACSVLPADA